MNLYKNKISQNNSRILTIFALFFLLRGILTQKKECFRDLVQSYSLNGFDEAQPLSMPMCPSIVDSCCQQVDQEGIFSNWIHGQEEETVNDRYNSNAKIYETLIEKLIKVQEFAKVSKNAIVKRVSNCKLLSDRILNFEIKEIAKQIRKNLNRMRDFFKETYKGFYCAICNYDNHRFFKKETKNVIFSEKFCRDMVEHSLGPLLVFHVDMAKYLNLVTKFVTSCDTRGEYNLEADFPRNMTFFEVQETKELLENCRVNRNKKDWFSYCKDVCMNFEIYSFSSFFEPNIDHIQQYTTFLQESLTIMSNFQLTHALLNKDTKVGKKERILQDVPVTKKPIYKPGLSPKINLAEWTIDFQVSGVSLFDEGRNSLVTDTMYNSIKTILQLDRENSNVKQASRLSQEDKKILTDAGVGRRLRSSTIVSFKTFICIVLASFMAFK